jgi:hypothetical protein
MYGYEKKSPAMRFPTADGAKEKLYARRSGERTTRIDTQRERRK